MYLDAFLDRIEASTCRELARLRWGATRWRCPNCPSTSGAQLDSRPRTTQCDQCGTQRSVTAGTVFGYTKMPVFLLLEALHAAFDLPTVSQLQEDFAFARSTAWFVIQRALKVLASGFDPGDEVGQMYQKLTVLLRRTGLRDLPHGAPQWFRDRQRQSGRYAVPFRVDHTGGIVWLGRLGPAESPTNRKPTVVPRLAETVAFELEWRRRVSLRWGPNWIRGVLASYALLGPEAQLPSGFWKLRGLRIPHVPRALFEPWREAGPW